MVGDDDCVVPGGPKPCRQRSLIGAADNGKMRRGCAVTGAGNILAGMMGVIVWIILPRSL